MSISTMQARPQRSAHLKPHILYNPYCPPSLGPPFFSQSSQLPAYSPTLFQPPCLANSAAALLLTPALQ